MPMTTNDVVAKIEADIIFGFYYPRERLVEEQLIATTQAKRHVVRSALKELELRGLVTREPNKGAMVKALSDAEIDQVYEMRALLQGAVVDKMLVPFASEYIEQLKVIHERYGKAIRKGDIVAVDHLNTTFHKTLYSACSNKFLTDDIERYSLKVRVIRSHAIADPDLLEKSCYEHSCMIGAIENNDKEKLKKLSVDHLWGALKAYRARNALKGV